MVTVTANGGVPQQPLNFDNSFIPDQLIAGVLSRVTRGDATVLSGATVNSATTLPRGTVLGKITIGAATGALKAGATGNGTISAIVKLTNVMTGVYRVVYTAATAFGIFAPNGAYLGAGVNGTATNNHLQFTMTAGGTAFVAGDTMEITVAAGSGKYIPAVATALDGSAVPCCILADDCAPIGADANTGVYLTGEFNQTALTMDTSLTAASINAVLADAGIFLKTVVSASDPT